MSEQSELYYRVCIIFLKKEYYLFWKDDLFFISNEDGKMLIESNQGDLLLAANKHKLSISDQSVDTLDIDHAFRVLKQMRRDRPLSEDSCRVLLDSINILEDMAKTLGMPVGLQDSEENASLNHLYDKIFWGNNLPSVTPEGKSYSPLVLPNEIKLIRKYLRGLWFDIYNQGFCTRMT